MTPFTPPRSSTTPPSKICCTFHPGSPAASTISPSNLDFPLMIANRGCVIDTPLTTNTPAFGKTTGCVFVTRPLILATTTPAFPCAGNNPAKRNRVPGFNINPATSSSPHSPTASQTPFPKPASSAGNTATGFTPAMLTSFTGAATLAGGASGGSGFEMFKEIWLFTLQSEARAMPLSEGP